VEAVGRGEVKTEYRTQALDAGLTRQAQSRRADQVAGKKHRVPPIERVQGPDIKGMRHVTRLPIKLRSRRKSTEIIKKSQLKQ
jgi:hypothetical protein